MPLVGSADPPALQDAVGDGLRAMGCIPLLQLHSSHALQFLCIRQIVSVTCDPSLDTLAERLRRRPAKPMGSPRVGSNPTGVDIPSVLAAEAGQAG